MSLVNLRGALHFQRVRLNATPEVARLNNYSQIDEKVGDRLPHTVGVFLKKIVEEPFRLTPLRAGEMNYIEAPPTNVIANELKNLTPGFTLTMKCPKSTWSDLTAPNPLAGISKFGKRSPMLSSRKKS